MEQVTVIDTETTGFDPAMNSIVEIAGVELIGDCHFTSLTKPAHRITFGAMAAHHITEDMVAEAPALEDVLAANLPLLQLRTYAAHNAAFDKSFVPQWMREFAWICTWRCAMVLWPDAESHSNQALRYELDIDVSDFPAAAGNAAHRALYDAWVTRGILREMTKLRTVNELVKMTAEPILLRKVRFGKHVNELWEEIPKSYLRWILTQDFDEDTLHTARFYLR